MRLARQCTAHASSGFQAALHAAGALDWSGFMYSSNLADCCSRIAEAITHQNSAGHFGQYLRQVRERHGYIGQVLGRGVVHDAEELRRAGSGVYLACPELPKHVAADLDGDLKPLVAFCFCSRPCFCLCPLRRPGLPWLLQPLRRSRRFACSLRGGARYAPGRQSSPRRKTQALASG